MLKYLRIAVTALSLTACVLLVALWVRSYERSSKYGLPGDSLVRRVSDDRTLAAYSMSGRLNLSITGSDSTVYFPLRRIGGFGVITKNGSSTLCIPYWSGTLAAVFLASAVWIPRQFSVRSLLIATTLVAVALGVIIVST